MRMGSGSSEMLHSLFLHTPAWRGGFTNSFFVMTENNLAHRGIKNI
jgi:hypothetical protein